MTLPGDQRHAGGLLTQLARFTDYRVQVTIFDPRRTPTCSRCARAVLAAIEAMPEYITRDTDMQGPYQFEPKVFEWILDFQFATSKAKGAPP
jgi:hypothetical protein